MNDARGLAPRFWNIPTFDEWTALGNYLGGNAGSKMRPQELKVGLRLIQMLQMKVPLQLYQVAIVSERVYGFQPLLADIGGVLQDISAISIKAILILYT